MQDEAIHHLPQMAALLDNGVTQCTELLILLQLAAQVAVEVEDGRRKRVEGRVILQASGEGVCHRIEASRPVLH
jgi:hypothetical protein